MTLMSFDQIVKLIAAISALIVAIAAAYGVIVLSASVEVESELFGKITLVPGSKASAPLQGSAGSVRPGTDSTVWESTCPEHTKVISGTCISQSGAVPLQNIGPNTAANRWECAWSGNVPKADVLALCLKIQ
ncbi:hypothetical protein HPT29_028480 (plasmid) [Microvirga terrae]|uniref:Uncharacterized protein n=1 Tax=Microvirga terrae TaxID=2740529 RepID=A0ABY5S039_9HYPH|nr:hypothetical protein [Microvirga terrae]UVF22840.1 hypothetical protein HPT29_028480 [Microvirga terrae]